MSIRRSIFTLLAGVTLGASHARAETLFFGIGDLGGGGPESHAYGVSGDGNVVVGSSWSESGGSAIRWTRPGGIQSLGDIPGGAFGSVAYAASWDGSFIVGTGRSAIGNEAFRWTAETGCVGLGDVPGGHAGSGAADVTPAGGVVVGTSAVSPSGSTGAMRWTAAGGMEFIGDFAGGQVNSIARAVSADGTMAVGSGQSASQLLPFQWTQSQGLTLLGQLPPNYGRGSAEGITPQGHVVDGYLGVSKFRLEAFRWTQASGYELLGALPVGETGSVAVDVSANGAVIVGYVDHPGARSAFIWTRTLGKRILKEHLSAAHGLDVGGWQLVTAHGVSDDGRTIVGEGINPNGDEEGWVVVLPPWCDSDLTGDGAVNTADLVVMLGNFGLPVPFNSGGDHDGDGVVTTADLVAFLGAFAGGCGDGIE